MLLFHLEFPVIGSTRSAGRGFYTQSLPRPLFVCVMFSPHVYVTHTKIPAAVELTPAAVELTPAAVELTPAAVELTPAAPEGIKVQARTPTTSSPTYNPTSSLRWEEGPPPSSPPSSHHPSLDNHVQSAPQLSTLTFPLNHPPPVPPHCDSASTAPAL